MCGVLCQGLQTDVYRCFEGSRFKIGRCTYKEHLSPGGYLPEMILSLQGNFDMEGLQKCCKVIGGRVLNRFDAHASFDE